MRFLILLFLLPIQLVAQSFSTKEIARWEKQSQRVSIIRDNWGIPHIYGKSDADAVFGLLYAQCEDDFKRVEQNYIEKLGRLAEVKGKDAIYDDLLIRMVLDSSAAIKDYQHAPGWLKELCNAFADGINFYLFKHPSVKPALLKRFQPWYPMLWTDGSIGAISTADIGINELKAFYGDAAPVAKIAGPLDEKATGSNGFAISPSISASGNAMLYINPHVSFYFRPEVHMVSETGLNAYGAVTWGQFFIYQGFNEFCGWMHTSNAVDAADSYIEQLSKNDKGWTYKYNEQQLPVTVKPIVIRYVNGSVMESKTIPAMFTHHGPIMAKRNGQYLSMKADNRLLNGLIQCWQRTRANSLAAFEKTLDLKGNISNNTVYADAAGNIGYWHGNRIPVRDPSFNWSKPVDGTIKATEWKGLHPISETVHLLNPANGWLQNCNSTPFTVAGTNSPVQTNYRAYMAPDGENFRGINAVRVLSMEKSYTLDKLIKAGYDKHLAAFELLVPALLKAFDKDILPGDTLYAYLAGPIAVLRQWDLNSGEKSIATTLAVEWGQKILPAIFRTRDIEDEELDQVAKTKLFAADASSQELLMPLLGAIRELQIKYGRWQLPWGEINRFQRISPAIDLQFDDAQPSVPVGFTSSTWGMLPSYVSRQFPGTVKRYGVNGNSFICAVEFGKKVKAKSLLAGGESGNPHSPHFKDQLEMYSKGEFKDVLFYKEDVLKHAERTYHPGD
ncbi:penicillin acylase family protein [Flavihumibacter profundi]|uniref:penicillin acylase family protein n=1 Tax=Flavihumibacter profundi TaxID=2716883 RepID=UPI001CC69354|nr:penicillin acylase family protein [Flavihumibacter profundi]MBZ5856591.1 penicillin acylase family protein [Flavihumibacter profundi]